MRKFLFIGLIFSTSTLFAQWFDTLTINNLHTTVNARGSIGDYIDSLGYSNGGGMWVTQRNRSIGYLANLWLAGLDDQNVLHLAAQEYSQSGNDFFPGPISDTADSTYLNKYERVWKVSKQQINNHITNYNSPGYTAPEAILNWPGNGDMTNGEKSVLAPFLDFNQNGVYEPWYGEAPFIRGDEAVYFIYNDKRDVHSETNGMPLNVEVHGMLYGFENILSGQDSSLLNTVFISYRIFFREGAYENFKVGFWFDYDLGNYINDGLGCDSAKNIAYAYELDSSGTDSQSFFPNYPAVGIYSLNKQMSGFSSYKNGTSAGNPAATSDPNNVQEYFNYLNNKWKDGRSIAVESPDGYRGIYNGDGYSTNLSLPTTNFVWDHSKNWYSSPGSAADMRLLSTFDITDTTNPQKVFELDMAITYTDNKNSILQAIHDLDPISDTIRGFITDSVPTYPIINLPQYYPGKLSLAVYPNPAYDKAFLEGVSSKATFEVYLISGQLFKKTAAYNANTGIDTKNWPEGLYLLKVIDEDKEQSLKLQIRR